MSVGFNSPGYEAEERDGVEVEVCIDLNGQTERNVSLTLAVVSGTATGQCSWTFVYIKIIFFFFTDGTDYDVEPFSVELTASEYISMDSVCNSIVLREDALLEVTETIVFELNSINSFVVISQSSAVFNILDTVRILTEMCGYEEHQCSCRTILNCS